MNFPKGITFIDQELQLKIDIDGFATLRLLPSEQADILLDEYAQFEDAHNALNLPFVTTSHTNCAELISAADATILRIVAPYIGLHFDNYKLLFSNFLVKASRPDSQTPPHQDVTLVDEQRFTSYSIWVALDDVDSYNGCLKVLPGSHRYHLGIRPNPSYPWRFHDLVERIDADMISVPLSKGEAMIFSHSLIHGSGPNHSDRPRVAAVIALHPSDADLLHFEVDSYDAKSVHKYAMNRDAFVSYVKGSHPSGGHYLGKIPFDCVQVSAKQYNRMRRHKGMSILGRMKNKIVGR